MSNSERKYTSRKPGTFMLLRAFHGRLKAAERGVNFTRDPHTGKREPFEHESLRDTTIKESVKELEDLMNHANQKGYIYKRPSRNELIEQVKKSLDQYRQKSGEN